MHQKFTKLEVNSPQTPLQIVVLLNLNNFINNIKPIKFEIYRFNSLHHNQKQNENQVQVDMIIQKSWKALENPR